MPRHGLTSGVDEPTLTSSFICFQLVKNIMGSAELVGVRQMKTKCPGNARRMSVAARFVLLGNLTFYREEDGLAFKSISCDESGVDPQ
ncbi:hypothetical protein chiPu_0020123 [Chiloscyllium punctatum]|uniref:Uncharacterized protein n=1 Tax=Chiloscyllium punctatum TaxID=137246 RepID=A0A401RU25_CHIPU|nr:hypothetical protein [Chiloscyllium punctatum]